MVSKEKRCGIQHLLLSSQGDSACLIVTGSAQLLSSGLRTSLRRFFALSAAIALNIRLRVCLTVATPFAGMACKVKSRLSQIRTGIQLQTLFSRSLLEVYSSPSDLRRQRRQSARLCKSASISVGPSLYYSIAMHNRVASRTKRNQVLL